MIAQHRANFLSGTVLGVVLGLSLGHVTIWRRGDSWGNDRPREVMYPGTPFEYSLGTRTAALPLGASSDAALTEVPADDEPTEGSPLQNAIAITRDERESPAPRKDPPAFPVDEPQPLNVEAAQPIPQQRRNDADIVRALIDSELGDLPQQQREVWYDALKGETREDAAGILRMWKLFGGPLPGALKHDSGPGRAGLAESDPPGFAAVPEQGSRDPIESAKAIRRRNVEMAFTPGFLRQIPYFTERADADGNLSRQLRTNVDFNSTMFIATGFPLDLAIQGPGFFQVVDASGNALLTRLGRFTLNRERQLTLIDGDRELRLDPEVRLPENIVNVVILPDGQVQYASADEPNSQVTNGGRVTLTLPLSPERLEILANGLFRLPAEHQGESLRPAPAGLIRQGALEVPQIDIEAERNSIRLLDELP